MLLVVFGILSLAFFFLPLKLYNSIPETILDSYNYAKESCNLPQRFVFQAPSSGQLQV
jgi:hypothetical protein